MRFYLVLTLALLGASAAASAQTAIPTVTEAAQLADAGDAAGALAAFRQRAAANPDDHVARLWIAQLHERMGDPDLAEPVYRSILLEDATNVDAMLGVASTLLARRETEEAVEILEAAEGRAPGNATVAALLGRAHRLAGRPGRAIDSFERAVTLEPSPEHRLRLEDVRLLHLHWAELRGFSEQFSGGTPDSWNGDVRVNYRLRETLRVSARGQAQRKFGASEQRGGGGVEWRWRPAVVLHGQALVGPGNRVMPEGDYLGEVAYTRGAAAWSAGLRHFDFTGARTTVFSPSVNWLASDRLALRLLYAAARSEWTMRPDGETGQSVQVRGDYRLLPRVWLQAGYAAGVEDFENYSIDRTGDFRASTWSGGLRLQLPTLTTVVGGYEHQWRENRGSMGRVTLSLRQRF